MARRPTEADRLADQRRLVQEAIDEQKTELDLSDVPFDLVREACAVKTLKKLTLGGLGEDVTTLPAEIGQLTALESLSVDSNNLTTLPDEIGALEHLQTLYAYENKLTALPESIGRLRNLRKLVLWSNELAALPATFGDLERLTECELKQNKLKELPASLGKLARLEALDLDANQLTDLPPDLSGMARLRRLTLRENQLSRLPRGLFTLPALVELDVSENQLTSLPDDLDRLATLRELSAESNQLTSLPKKLFSLPLTALDLKNNSLETVPKELASMPSLLKLELYGNPIPEVGEESLEGRAEVLELVGLFTPKSAPHAPANAAAILKAYSAKLDKLARELKKRGEKGAKVLAFVRGQSDVVPTPSPDDEDNYGALIDLLAPYPEWTFLERRVLLFIAQEAWRFKQPGHDYFSGFDERFYRWLSPHIKEEPAGSTLFADVARELVTVGRSEEELLAGGLRELHEVLLRDDQSLSSFGRWVIDVAPRHEALLARQDRSSVKEAIIGLFIRHAKELFVRVGDGLLTIEQDEDGETHVPYDALEHACAVDPKRYEPLLLEGIERTDCTSCRAESGRVLAKRYPARRAEGIAIARRTLQDILERSNQEARYEFPWSGAERWTDGMPQYVGWALDTFGDELLPDVRGLVEHRRRYSLDLAEVLAKRLGQAAEEMVAEGLDMSSYDDDLAPHFRRVFTMLAPLEWSKHHDKAWELARSEHTKVRATACEALARVGSAVVPKAKELLASKKGHEREAGVRILSLVNDDASREVLRGLLDTETSDDARDLIVKSFYRDEKTCDAGALAHRVDAAEARGKLAKPAAKWIDEKKLRLPPFDARTVRWFFYRQTRPDDIEIDPEARGPLALVDREKAGPFASKLLDLVLENGGASAKNRFALALIGATGGDDVVASLEELAVDARNENAIKTLGMLETQEAARALDRVMKVYRVKYPNLRGAAQEAFDQIAARLGMTSFELSDAMVPPFAGVVFGADRKPVPPKGADKKKAKALADEVKAAATSLGANLEYYLIVRRRWDAVAWEAFFGANPLAHAFALGFVWGAYDASGKLGATFRVTKDNERVGPDGKRVGAPKGAKIGLVHPLEMDPSERARWLAALETAQVTPAFPQLDRPTFAPNEEEQARTKCFRFEDRELAGLTFKGRAERRGWRRGSVVDSGEVSAYHKVFAQDRVEAFVRTSGLSVQADESEVTLKDVFFVRPSAVTTGSYTYDEPEREDDPRLIALRDVPPIVFSEVVADLTAITKTKQEED